MAGREPAIRSYGYRKAVVARGGRDGRKLYLTARQVDHAPLQEFAPATCLVVTLRRLKTLVTAIERIKAASAGSS